MSVAILCGGGPAPGMNTVVGSIAKSFLKNGIKVIGLHHGYTGLFRENAHIEELDFLKADAIFNRGGSYLKMSRFKPTPEDFEKNFNLKLFEDNNIKLLVTVGGDDTASTANRVAKFLSGKGYSISNIHVPKTIDNDLPLPNHAPTFGYTTAEDSGAKIAATIYEDARTSENWFVIAAMGRSAGHLAFGIGSACHLPMIVIPEMFNKVEITVDRIVNLVISAMIKRKIMGLNYGVAIISEGVFHELSEEEIKKSGINFTYDDHGHPELGKISKAQMFNELISKKLKEIGLDIKSRPIELGYEVRCVNPVGFDLVYCTLLGNGVYKLFKEGTTGCMVYVDNAGDVSPLFLKDMEGADGKIPPRPVDIEDQKSQSIINNILHYITESDYESAKTYVSDPAVYDFRKILSW
ncbi:MAG: 6-phosphofructokinase [Candidatus Marinimicrobia bacterium]|nr:6-phosphofructokinase [Candidatus Neomarinimicrobiota bacterium]